MSLPTWNVLREHAIAGVGGIAFVIEILAAALLIVAVVRGLVLLAGATVTGSLDERVHVIRLRLGRGIVLALEFLVAADVLRTIVAPTIEHILTVGAVVLLRTVLAVAVEWELREEARRENSGA